MLLRDWYTEPALGFKSNHIYDRSDRYTAIVTFLKKKIMEL